MITDHKCTRCRRADVHRAHECKPCHAVTLTLISVHRDWTLSEIGVITSKLKGQTLTNFTNEAKERGAIVSEKLGRMIYQMAYLAGMQPDAFKLRICGAALAYKQEMESLPASARRDTHAKVNECVSTMHAEPATQGQ